MIFIFGSNEAGRHGKGAALYARKCKGAIYGQGFGLQGESFAIPTKDGNLKTLPLTKISEYVNLFRLFAESNPDLLFQVTEIGCGLAGYSPEDIAPMFSGELPENVYLPESFKEILNGYSSDC